jgi:hypothetical protein
LDPLCTQTPIQTNSYVSLPNKCLLQTATFFE